jgi:hypothetical protein
MHYEPGTGPTTSQKDPNALRLEKQQVAALLAVIRDSSRGVRNVGNGTDLAPFFWEVRRSRPPRWLFDGW